MTVHHLTRAMVVTIHAELIRDYGGSSGIRDENLLQSAIARTRHLENYAPGTPIPEMAASVGWGLLKNHAFIDGNKRIAFMGMLVFLHLNGFRVTCTEADETITVLRAAAGEMSESEWTKWVIANSAPGYSG
jgi:death on curing protein